VNSLGTVLYLDVELRRIRKMLEESWPQKVAEQAEQSRRTSEETRYREAYAARREVKRD
jgi:hypothetical protein